MTEFVEFPHISTPAAFVKAYEDMAEFPAGDYRFSGSVKLHGTNAAVLLNPGDTDNPIAGAQSRKRLITPENDNYGFAAYVAGLEPGDVLHRRCTTLAAARFTHLFGEWVGNGIQSKVAVSKMLRHFVPFAHYSPEDGFEYTVGLGSVPAFGLFDASISSAQDLRDVLTHLQDTYVPVVEEQCPYAALFGVTGPGEGVVWRVTRRGPERLPEHIRTVKTKGTAHHGDKKPKHSRRPKVPQEQIDALWVMGCDERLEQCKATLRGWDIEPEMRHIPLFIKEFMQDFIRENPGIVDGKANKTLRTAFQKYAIAAYRESL